MEPNIWWLFLLRCAAGAIILHFILLRDHSNYIQCIYLHPNYWQLKPQRVSWYHCHCYSVSLIKKPSTERCYSSFQNSAVTYPFCSGYNLPFTSSSYQQWRSCLQELSCALNSSCTTPIGQWWSHDHLDSSHGCHRFHTKTILRVSHLPLRIDDMFVATFWTY